MLSHLLPKFRKYKMLIDMHILDSITHLVPKFRKCKMLVNNWTKPVVCKHSKQKQMPLSWKKRELMVQRSLINNA